MSEDAEREKGSRNNFICFADKKYDMPERLAILELRPYYGLRSAFRWTLHSHCKGASGYARQPALRAAYQWLPRCLAVWLLGYCSAVHRPYSGRPDQAGALPVIFRYVTLLNVAPKAGCRASFASSLSRRAGQAPHQLTVLGHLNGWGRFTPAAPPSLSAIKLGL